MFQNRLLMKILMIGFLLICCAIGLTIVQSVVYERQRYQNHVISDIAYNQLSNQTLISPFISVPFNFTQACDAATSPKSSGNTCTYTASELFFPTESAWDAKFAVTNQKYNRTIYKTISYDGHLNQKASFVQPNIQNRNYLWDQAKFILPIKDLRGLKNKPILTINQKKLQLDFPQNNNQTNFSYIEVAIPQIDLNNLSYTLDLELEGLSNFSLVPNNENSSFTAQGNWGDIKFSGDSLPQKDLLNVKDFTASWNNLTLGYQYQQRLNDCWNKENCQQYFSNTQEYTQTNGFGIEFIEPVNIYSQTDRAIKYGWIITLITFGCFFLFEMIKGLRIHPIQYLLVGTAQSIFFILLLSLSEQISFVSAYVIAGFACIGLMSWYLSFVLKNWRSTALFTVLLGGLYGVMYLLLQSAEKTFLMGSIFSFLVVATIMFITRHIDWYQVADQKSQTIPPTIATETQE